MQLLALFQRSGLRAALLAKVEGPRSDKRLLLMHALIAAMQWRLGEALALQRLARGRFPRPQAADGQLPPAKKRAPSPPRSG